MIYKELPVKVNGSEEYAKLQAYILDTPGSECEMKIKKRPLVLICPGGGYHKLSYREGEPLAMYFLSRGYHACVLRYSVSPARFPTAVLEVGKALEMIVSRQEEWKIETEQIFVHGASAGGHLAASYGIYWNQDFMPSKIKPAGIILSYPVITADKMYGHQDSFRNLLGDRYEICRETQSLETQVTSTMPPTFIWHTAEDATVPVENSLLLAMALRRVGVPMELHIFPKGVHGLSLANSLVEKEDGRCVQDECKCWIDLALTWMNGLTKKENKNE